MSFELDSVFHTETMVKILHRQGQVYHATQLCEKIISKHPEKETLLRLLEGIKKGQIPEKVPAYQVQVVSELPPPETLEDETTEPGITFEGLEMKEEMAEDWEKERKLALLEDLLIKVQERKNEIH